MPRGGSPTGAVADLGDAGLTEKLNSIKRPSLTNLLADGLGVDIYLRMAEARGEQVAGR